MNILVIDDHPLVRRGIVSTLSFENEIEKISEASNIKEAEDMMENEHYDSAFVDLNLGKEDGLELVLRARKKAVKTKFIVLTSSMKKEDFCRAQRAQIDGYILKEAFAEDIVFALKTVNRGKNYFDPELVKLSMEVDKKAGLEELTPREMEVLREVGNGLNNIEIGNKLYISENTVKKHISSILSKLSLTRRTQAALLAKEYFSQ